jgi:hypothetical protein
MNNPQFARGDEWTAAARANFDLLSEARSLSEAERQALTAHAQISFTARAALFLLDLEHVARGPAFISRGRVARRLHNALPYRFDGDGQSILSVELCIARGYWACADTSAAAAAAFVGRNRDVKLCTETVGAFPRYAHTRLVVAGGVVEPWPEARRPEAHGCTLLDNVSELLLAPT